MSDDKIVHAIRDSFLSSDNEPKSLSDAIIELAKVIDRAHRNESPMPPVVEAGSWIARDVSEAIKDGLSEIAESISDGLTEVAEAIKQGKPDP